MRRSRGIPRAVALLALVSTFAPTRAAAQVERDTWETRIWMGDVAFLSANALLAGLTAGILQELRDGSFSTGFARGALGGAVSYGGRRLAVEDFWGAGLLGRQVSAVGASVARNASEGRPVFSRFFVPIGPVSLHVDRGADASVRAKLDVHGAAWLAAAVLDERWSSTGALRCLQARRSSARLVINWGPKTIS